MTPDSPLVSELRPSPNFGERRGVVRPDMVILHYTGMADGEVAVRWLTMPVSEVSCHYLVHEDGRIVQLVSETARAWHAGAGSWRGCEDINSRSIGIEIVNPGHEHGYRAFPPTQVDAVIGLCRECVDRWSVPPENLLAHSDVAPARKRDPGELFPWDRLFSAGLGHYVVTALVTGGRCLARGDSGEAVAAFQSSLACYGYGLDLSGAFDGGTEFATIAFQRHFRPSRVDGIADVSTIDTLHRLLESLGRPPFEPRDEA